MPVTEFENCVSDHYEGLYRFALSLTQRESEAADLTQQTFFLWATKGHQLRDKSKLKSWLFTTLHREFLGGRRRQVRFPHHDLESAQQEVPAVMPEVVQSLDASILVETLGQIEETYRAPLVLFYLEDHSYREIAAILDIPMGTVMSRLARGKAQLRQLLLDPAHRKARNIVPLSTYQDGRTRQT